MCEDDESSPSTVEQHAVFWNAKKVTFCMEVDGDFIPCHDARSNGESGFMQAYWPSFGWIDTSVPVIEYNRTMAKLEPIMKRPAAKATAKPKAKSKAKAKAAAKQAAKPGPKCRLKHRVYSNVYKRTFTKFMNKHPRKTLKLKEKAKALAQAAGWKATANL